MNRIHFSYPIYRYYLCTMYILSTMSVFLEHHSELWDYMKCFILFWMSTKLNVQWTRVANFAVRNISMPKILVLLDSVCVGFDVTQNCCKQLLVLYVIGDMACQTANELLFVCRNWQFLLPVLLMFQITCSMWEKQPLSRLQRQLNSFGKLLKKR